MAVRGAASVALSPNRLHRHHSQHRHHLALCMPPSRKLLSPRRRRQMALYNPPSRQLLPCVSLCCLRFRGAHQRSL